MRSALAARMYAAVQLSSQQQQMYVGTTKKNENTINNISKIYQIVFFCAFRFALIFFLLLHIKERENSSFRWASMCVYIRGCLLHVMRQARKKRRKKGAENFFSFARFNFFLSPPTSASAQSHDAFIGGEKSSRQKNQKHSIDGQAMKSLWWDIRGIFFWLQCKKFS